MTYLAALQMQSGAPDGNGTVLILFGCFLFALSLFVYVFYQPGAVEHAPQKTRLSYLDERRESVYENLRDLSFEHKAGKLSDVDYEQQRQGLENEAAVILAEMEELQNAPVGKAKLKKA
ncbi:MAG TPA: hypothetical protein VGL89_17840 [Candidatus Koribacter sp.]|jgi:hypothetical protein